MSGGGLRALSDFAEVKPAFGANALPRMGQQRKDLKMN